MTEMGTLAKRAHYLKLSNQLNGVFLVNKPTGMTSTDVVQKIRLSLENQLTKEGALNSGGGGPQRSRKRKPLIKVGHGGTVRFFLVC
jgi:tRNA U55 pseudouridine synthase TruB